MDFLIVANWKMNGSREIAQEYKKLLENYLKGRQMNNLVICPPSVYLSILKSDLYNIGAQDVSSFESFGPHTGEISANMLRDLGCGYVIIGHSERKAQENPSLIKAKIKAAQHQGLKVILCVGETAQERNDGLHIASVTNQLDLVLSLDCRGIYFAYEPLWAIGSGQDIEVSDLAEMTDAITSHLLLRYQMTKREIQLLYGGSVSEQNAKELMSLAQINGLLIGASSLECQRIINIIDEIC